MTITQKSKLGWPIFIGLSIIPAILWAMAFPIQYRFAGDNLSETFSLTVNAIGQLLGLIGMAMFALNFILSARLKSVEGFFGGMNRVYIAHHIIGGLSFILLLFHPLFLFAKYIPEAGQGAVKFFFLSADQSVNFGVVSLGLLIIFLVITFFVKIPYQYWKFTHKFLSLAFFFGALHVAMIPSDVTSVKMLQYYMWAVILLAYGAILYRTILGALLVPTERFIIEEIVQVTPSIWEIGLKHEKGKAFNFEAGQFIFIGFPKVNALREVHPFSISGAPNGDRIRVGIKGLGDYTKQLGLLKVGDVAQVEGPFGRTSYRYYANKKQIWIAGGIGITPFLGMARDLKTEDGYEVDLYFSLVDRTDTPFVSELEEIAKRNPNFHFYPWYSKEVGFLNADAIVTQSQTVLGKEIFLCGPPPMMKSIKEQFKKYGIDPKDIHSEEFSLN